MKCKKCGAEISDTTRFCPNCGEAVPARKEKRPMSKGLKFVLTLIRVICFTLIIGDMLFILFITKFQGVTLKDLWDIAIHGDWIMFLLIVGAFPYVISYLFLFHLFKKFIVIFFMLIGIALCVPCLIKAKKPFMIFMFIVMAAFVILGIFAFTQMQDINDVINSNHNSSSAI